MSKQQYRFHLWHFVVGLIFLSGLYATFIRFTQGLGAATNLTDVFPWGLWIGFDVMVGVGLAAGGFTIAATVHIFNLEKYESISRPSLLTAFLGYQLVVIGLLFDIGHPLRLWHPLIMWNPHSVMFEVAWCVTLYSVVLALEFSPIVFERFNMKLPLRMVRMIYLPLVILGVLLSTLHQSSLGTLYVIVPDKLYGLWYTPLLPVFFFISAISAGLAMTIFESCLSARAFGKQLEKEVLVGLARVIVVVLAVYCIFRFCDLSNRGNLGLAFLYTPQSSLFWCEMGFGVILPMILLAFKRIRHSSNGLFFSSLLIVLGFVIGRMNVAITGMLHSETYFPKWSEIAVTMSIVAAGFVIFGMVVKYFPVFETGETDQKEQNHISPVGMNWRGIAGMWVLVLVGIGGFVLANQYQQMGEYPFSERPRKVLIAEPNLVSLPAEFSFPQAEDSPGIVSFDHELHVGAGDSGPCLSCHPRLYRFRVIGSVRTAAPADFMHSEKSCGACHNGELAASIEDDCESCHQG